MTPGEALSNDVPSKSQIEVEKQFGQVGAWSQVADMYMRRAFGKLYRVQRATAILSQESGRRASRFAAMRAFRSAAGMERQRFRWLRAIMRLDSSESPMAKRPHSFSGALPPVFPDDPATGSGLIRLRGVLAGLFSSQAELGHEVFSAACLKILRDSRA